MWVAVTAPGTEIDAAERGMGCLALAAGNLEKNAPRFEAYRKRIQTCEPVGAFVNNRVATVNWMFCHEDSNYAKYRMRQLIDSFSSMAAQTIEVSQAFPANNYGATGLLGQFRVDPDDEKAKAVPDGLTAGNPQELIDTIKSWESAGVDQMVLMINSREVIPQDEVMASLALFEREVMPHFKKSGIKVNAKEAAHV
jgi:alkanesulfonate monooxygenase SsuD/methylene tetrahydromethanopterin reductase-like flavin-dependent oxidoreductase (luciferase family)